MKTLDLLAPAGSYDAVVAAVQNGADAVYFGMGDFNARRMAKNFTDEELAQAVEYCRLRGVKTHVTLNTLVTDRELSAVADVVSKINRLGADAVIVADLGVARMIRQVAPDLPIHASTQMTIHNLDGVIQAAEHGFTRVVLARELSRDEIRFICQNAPIEIEVFAHGALCVCYSGQCYFSGVIGKRSGNRGLCAQPCRMAYRLNERSAEGYPLSMKDLCMAQHLRELRKFGVASIKIEGRMKRPEYVAAVTRIYANLLKEDRLPTQDEFQTLADAFSRQGFTDGYYTGAVDRGMLGTRLEEDARGMQGFYRDVRETYSGERATLGVRFYCVIRKDEPAVLAAEDTDGLRHIAKGPIPQSAQNHALTASLVRNQLRKTGGTPFGYLSAKVLVEDGLALPLSVINSMRRECTDALLEQRREPPHRAVGAFKPGVRLLNEKRPVSYTVSVLRAEQVTDELLRLSPAMVTLPLAELCQSLDRVAEWSAHTTLCVGIPRIVRDLELPKIKEQLGLARAAGIRHAMVGNLGHIKMAVDHEFILHGDFGLNVFNSQTLKELKQDGFESATLSPELSFAQIRDLSKCLPTEILVYGRLPLMLLEHCVIKDQTGKCLCSTPYHLTDRTGATFPLVRDGESCRTVILNTKKLFLADKRQDYTKLGLWGGRLLFTTEHPKECAMILERYLSKNDFKPPVYTRGLYYRGVE